MLRRIIKENVIRKILFKREKIERNIFMKKKIGNEDWNKNDLMTRTEKWILERKNIFLNRKEENKILGENIARRKKKEKIQLEIIVQKRSEN